MSTNETIAIRCYDIGAGIGEALDVSRSAAMLHKVLGACRAFDARLQEWATSDRQQLTLADERACARALEEGAQEMRLGALQVRPLSVLAEATSNCCAIASLQMISGMPNKIHGAWVPNRLTLTLSPTLETTQPVKRLFTVIVESTQPAWAHVAWGDRPREPVVPFATGTPIVGPLTYLCDAFPPPPNELPFPASKERVGGGWLFIAGRAPENPKLAEHQLAHALALGGVLSPLPR